MNTVPKRHPKQKIVAREKCIELADYIREYVGTEGYPPTYREMAEALEIRSISTIKLLVDVMLDLGMATMSYGKSRTIRLVDNDKDSSGVS